MKHALDLTVERCVNTVGVNLNTASKHLLTYVSGLGPALAQNIVTYRAENGPFASRQELQRVPRLGAKAFEQCAGFLRIADGKNPLDNTAVHPERYELVRQMAKDSGCTVEELISSPEKLHRVLNRMAEDNTPIVVKFWWTQTHNHIIFYGHSLTLQTLYIFPYIQIFIIVVFVMVIFMAFRSMKQNEQSRVWVGLAKETAHPLGTPTSSLLGWIEYLREQPVDQMAVDEMQKDLAHLMKIVDRFSKIGSDTPLTTKSLNEVVGESVMYFRKRIPRTVTLDYNGLAIDEVKAKVNVALFEWVVENLMKNSLDALQGHGEIVVTIGSDAKNAWVDVADTGKTFIQSTYERFQKIVPKENILVVTTERYRDIMKEQLPDLAPENLLLEPYARSTAPCIAYATYTLLKRDPEAKMVVTPSDHLIEDEDLFIQTITRVFDYVDTNDVLMTLGVVPTRPDTNYGYIQACGGSEAYKKGVPKHF